MRKQKIHKTYDFKELLKMLPHHFWKLDYGSDVLGERVKKNCLESY